MSTIADLSGGTAKVLLALINRGGAWGSPAEMMAEAGVSKPTYLEAKRDLQGKFSDLADNFLYPRVKELVPAGQGTLPPVKEVDLRGQGTLPAVATGHYEPDFDLASLADRALPPMTVEETPRQRCARADREGQGQVEALQAAWFQLVGQHITAFSAKELLGLAPSEDVYDAAEAAISRGISKPFGYVRKMLLNRAAKPQPSPSSPVQDDHSGQLDPWDDEWEAKVRATEEKLRRAGVPSYYLGGDE